MKRYGVSLRIQSECGKIRTRITPNTDTFHAVLLFLVPNKIGYLREISMNVSTRKQHTEAYLLLSSTLPGKYMEILISKLSIKPGYTCLDVGCGTGNSTTKIAEKVGERGLVIGLDPDKERIDTARKHNFLENTKFYEGTISEIDLKEGLSDAAISNLVYHWMDTCEQRRTTKKVFSVLKSHGVFALFINKDYPYNLARIVPYLSPEYYQRVKNNLFFFTEEYYREFFAKETFEFISFDQATFDTPFDSIDSYLQLVDATYATNEFSIAYYRNKDRLELPYFPDGTLCSSADLFCIVLRKP